MSERAKELDTLKRKLTRKMMKAVRAYDLIAPETASWSVCQVVRTATRCWTF